MKVCIYSRVSTGQQDTTNQSVVLSSQESWTEAPGELAELLYALTGWVARMESQRRSERTRAGLARVKAQGKRLGRPPGSKDKRKRRRRQRFTAL